jgi:hypothetical protein
MPDKGKKTTCHSNMLGKKKKKNIDLATRKIYHGTRPSPYRTALRGRQIRLQHFVFETGLVRALAVLNRWRQRGSRSSWSSLWDDIRTDTVELLANFVFFFL